MPKALSPNQKPNLPKRQPLRDITNVMMLGGISSTLIKQAEEALLPTQLIDKDELNFSGFSIENFSDNMEDEQPFLLEEEGIRQQTPCQNAVRHASSRQMSSRPMHMSKR